MNFYVVTIFPEVCEAYTDASILGRAQKSGAIKVSYLNPRDFTKDKHRKTDDRPYGGGPGMVMKPEPLLSAVAKATRGKRAEILIMSPRGKQFTQEDAKRLSKKKNVVLISGRYEGIDARVGKILKAKEVSVGSYTLTGGELPALTIIDAVARHIPGVLGKGESLEEGRIAGGEVYTRPEILAYKGKKYQVPKVLLSGSHKHIDAFRSKGS